MLLFFSPSAPCTNLFFLESELHPRRVRVNGAQGWCMSRGMVQVGGCWGTRRFGPLGTAGGSFPKCWKSQLSSPKVPSTLRWRAGLARQSRLSVRACGSRRDLCQTPGHPAGIPPRDGEIRGTEPGGADAKFGCRTTSTLPVV